MRSVLALIIFVPGLLTADDASHLALLRIRETVATSLEKSDNYICAQDLSRFYYVAASPEMACQQPPTIPSTPMRVRDRLKLDVAMSNGGEIYSWHGEHKFSASSVSEVVRNGPISSGSFTGYLRNIFAERGVSFTYRGSSTEHGLELIHFDYEVPLSASHYQVQAGSGFELAPFHGSFSAKAGTFELYSLTVTLSGENLSPKANICSAESRVVYQLVKIADHESLLPASYDLLVGSHNGIFTESKGLYSECREYRGESVVKFDTDDSAGPTVKSLELQPEPLNAGLILPIALRTDIDEDSAYAGLPVEAVLQHDVRLKKGVKLSRGARLHGMVTRFDVFPRPLHSVSLKLEFDSITDGDKLYLCTAKHYVETTYAPGFAGGRGRGMGAASLHPIENQPSDGTLQFTEAHVHLDKNYSTEFITVR
jgi:hypothetical protein